MTGRQRSRTQTRQAPGARQTARSVTSAGRPAGRRSVLRTRDIVPIAAVGILARPARALLSAAGIALGIATMVAVFGISASSRAQLIAEIDALGTNLLTVSPGQAITGQNFTLPKAAPAMIRRIGPVLTASAIGDVQAAVYRNDHIPSVNTDAITVYCANTNLLATLQGHLARGRFLSAATSRYPAVVLGSDAARALGIDRADGSVRVWLGNQWFGVVGILEPLPLAPELDRTALIGFAVAERLLHSRGRLAQVY